MAKMILVSYAGYPYTPSSLMPDNGLASLGGALISAGHQALILDYGTVETMERMVSAPHRKRLEDIYHSLANRGKGPLAWSRQASALLKLRRMERKLAARQTVEVESLAEELSGIVSREKPDMIGFKLWNGDGFEGSIAMARRIRRDHPGLAICGGGPHVYLFRELILRRAPVFDFLVADEAENTVLQLMDGDMRLDRIPGLIHRRGEEILSNPVERPDDLDRLPMPVYDEHVYPAMRGDSKIKVMIIDESRGCVYTCPFCPQSSRDENVWRCKSAARVAEEIERLYGDPGVRLFRFGGQFTPGRLMEDVARLVLERGLDIEFTSFAHIKAMRGIDFHLLRRAGLRAVFYGVESGSQKLLNGSLNKKTTTEEIERVIGMTKNAGILTSVSIIHPAPGETAETRRETLGLLERARPDSVLVYFPGVYPRSRWATDPGKYGIETEKDFSEKIMNYKIKTMYPPRFWDPLPYSIDGMGFAKFTAVASRFVEQVEKLGITTYVTDESFLFCEALGMPPEKYAERVKRAFFTGDSGDIREMVRAVNDRSSRVSSTGDISGT